MRFGFYLLNQKGEQVLASFLDRFGAEKVAAVVAARDTALDDDRFESIASICASEAIEFSARSDKREPNADVLIAVGWRWLIKTDRRLLVTHDSLLPRYRGFAPLVNQLINGESEIGVSVLEASEEYDRGPVLAQRSVQIEYPITIAEAIDAVIPLFCDAVCDVANTLISDRQISAEVQDESAASYSLWRDDQDFAIDWSHDAAGIRRMIDAVGSPYRGASTTAHGERIRIFEAVEVPDVLVENRDPGKVLFVREGKPVVVCGKGLLRLEIAHNDANGQSIIPLKRFRTRFV